MIKSQPERVAIDDFYDIVLFPLHMLWFLVPSGLRQRIMGMPRETVLFLVKVVWAMMAYYWLYTIISPYLAVPEGIKEWYDYGYGWCQDAYQSTRIWFSKVQLTSFTVGFPGFSLITWILTRLPGRKPEYKRTYVEQCVNSLANVFYVPERAIQGSSLIPAKELPTFVCYLFGVREGSPDQLLGCGFRVQNAILTAAHNLAGLEQVKIMSNSAVCVVDVDKAVVHPYDDFAYFKLSDRDFSILGMSSGKLLDHAVPKGYPMMCQAYGPGTPVSFTMGAVTPIELFGKVTYNGSTTHGFSGTPYIQHKTIVGMHLGAGMVNLGLDAAYMAMLLSIKPESTEDWLMDMIEEDQLNNRAVMWERSPIDPEEVYIKRQGKYFTMDADAFLTVYKPQSIVTESLSVKDKLPTFTYSDSKNGVVASAHESANAGAPGPMSEIRNCVQTQLTASSYQTPSSIKTLEESLATEAQELMLAQQNDPSGCTSKSITYQPERSRRRQKQKLKKLGPSSQKHTNPGSPGLELIR